MDEQRDRELGDALAGLPVPPYDDAFLPQLWSQIAAESSSRRLDEDVNEPAGPRTRPRRPLGSRFAFAAIVILLALVAALVTAVAVPGLTRSLPVLGRQIRDLERENQQLRGNTEQVAAQQRALLGEVATAYQATLDEDQTGAQAVAESTGILPVVRGYFAALAAAEVVGDEGERAAQALDGLIAPDSPLRERALYLVRGRRAQAEKQGNTATAATTIVGVYDVDLNETSGQAEVTVWPGLTFETWIDGEMAPQASCESWAYHTLSLTKSDDGQWQVADDVYRDGRVPAQLRAGGAPKELVREAERLQDELAGPQAAPPAAAKTLRKVFGLINESDYAAASDYFAPGMAARVAGLRTQRPVIDVRAIVSVRGLDPLPSDSVLLQLQVNDDVRFKGDSMAGFETYWVLQKQPDGRWLISDSFSGL
jgi:ketosteroid isomerase-like protein